MVDYVILVCGGAAHCGKIPVRGLITAKYRPVMKYGVRDASGGISLPNQSRDREGADQSHALIASG